MEQLEQLQKFIGRLNSEPAHEAVEYTPDGRAKTITISHIEMTLDELFFGQWSTSNFTWSAIANEVQGSLTLEVINPVNGQKLTRIGAASVIIMVDKIPQGFEGQERNQWAINPMNKKPNALDLAFPKLKAECLKNAAQSLGKIFGRDLNRKNADTYKPFKITPANSGMAQLPPTTFEKLCLAAKNGGDEFEIREAMEALAEVMTETQKATINTLLKAR
jgi:hypothetical protein